MPHGQETMWAYSTSYEPMQSDMYEGKLLVLLLLLFFDGLFQRVVHLYDESAFGIS